MRAGDSLHFLASTLVGFFFLLFIYLCNFYFCISLSLCLCVSCSFWVVLLCVLMYWTTRWRPEKEEANNCELIIFIQPTRWEYKSVEHKREEEKKTCFRVLLLTLSAEPQPTALRRCYWTTRRLHSNEKTLSYRRKSLTNELHSDCTGRTDV